MQKAADLSEERCLLGGPQSCQLLLLLLLLQELGSLRWILRIGTTLETLQPNKGRLVSQGHHNLSQLQIVERSQLG